LTRIAADSVDEPDAAGTEHEAFSTLIVLDMYANHLLCTMVCGELKRLDG